MVLVSVFDKVCMSFVASGVINDY